MSVSAGNQLRLNLAKTCLNFRQGSGAHVCGPNRFEKVLDITARGSMAKEYFRTVLSAWPERGQPLEFLRGQLGVSEFVRGAALAWALRE